jgi:hypothetical protein
LEWESARQAWLVDYEHVIVERRDLAARAFALEQARQEWLNEQTPLAQKRMERLEKLWAKKCEATASDLIRLRETLAAEALRIDDMAQTLRRDRLAAWENSEALDEQRAACEAERTLLAAERANLETPGSVHRLDADLQVLSLREEVESLARLLIDAPRPLDQAA